MKDKIKNWLVIGVPKNWETALSQPVPIWGLKLRYQAEFQSINNGDFLWFYSTSPIGGVIGLGIVKDKYIDNVNLIWEEELRRREVIWPLRFRIYVLKVLPRMQWKTERIKISDFRLFWQIGFQLLSNEYALELLERAKKIFGMISSEDLFTGATITNPLLIRESPRLSTPVSEETLTFSHKDLQDQIAEIGKLQFYYSQVEYAIDLPGEKKSLDVVWKREVDGSPTFAFEVELSEMLERAIERLKFAFRKWNSRPGLIIPDSSLKKVRNILSINDREFSEQIKIYKPIQIVELLNQKRKLKTVEQDLDIY